MGTNQTSTPPQDWQETLLNEMNATVDRDTLFNMLKLIRQYYESPDAIPALAMLVGSYLSAHDTINKETRDHLVTVVRLTGFLNELRSEFFCFDSLFEYIDKENLAEREVRRD